jgi:hypothetical protein
MTHTCSFINIENAVKGDYAFSFQPMSAPVRTGEPMSVQSLSVVVDTMLQGLGRQLRCCGVDVNILSTGTSHDEAAKVIITTTSSLTNLRIKEDLAGLRNRFLLIGG